MSGITINPQLTSNAAGSFGVQWDGLIQGMAMPDPAVRFFLASGFLNPLASLPMWGGVAVSEKVPVVPGSPPGTADVSLGGAIDRATNISTSGAALSLTGFSVFDQAYGMINSPQSPVPLAPQGGQVMFYRLNSGARIAVACSPALVSLEGSIITSQVSWDWDAQMLVPYVAAYPANVLTGATFASTGGGQVTFGTTTSHGVSVGSVFEISGALPAGYNGQYNAIAGTTGSTLVGQRVLNQSTDPGAYVSGGQLDAGGGALPVRVLKIVPNNSMTVSYDPTTGFATWNRSAAAALILI